MHIRHIKNYIRHQRMVCIEILEDIPIRVFTIQIRITGN